MKSRPGDKEEFKDEEAGAIDEAPDLAVNYLMEVDMPRGDGTGPQGNGPDGWGLGPCGKGQNAVPAGAGRGMGRRGGMGRGAGMGRGRGMGRGFGRGMGYPVEPANNPVPPKDDRNNEE